MAHFNFSKICRIQTPQNPLGEIKALSTHIQNCSQQGFYIFIIYKKEKIAE